MSRRIRRPLVSLVRIGAIPMVVTGTHDPYLVALSILVASFASYTALDLSGHVGPARGFARRVWLVAAALTIGGGIWSMHFGGMMAVMGLAISGMHYTAMRAAIFTAHGPVHEAQTNAGLDRTNLALAVAGITFSILAFASVASLFERKRAEEALRQAQADLARVTRVNIMAELTASLAHEVNQPISAAVTAADACLSWLGRDPPNLEEARATGMGIVKDGSVAAEIITRIRLLFKKGTPQRELVDVKDVNEVIREMIVLLRSEVAR